MTGTTTTGGGVFMQVAQSKNKRTSSISNQTLSDICTLLRLHDAHGYCGC